MLVLSRHRDESIMINDDIMVTVIEIRGDKVRLGIDAPPHVPVHRREVYEAIQRENRKAAITSASQGDTKSGSEPDGTKDQAEGSSGDDRQTREGNGSE